MRRRHGCPDDHSGVAAGVDDDGEKGAAAQALADATPAQASEVDGRGAAGTPVTVRQWVALGGLALSTFVFTTSEFMPVGLLTSIAGSFGLADTQASLMVSLYAWCVTILSLPLMVLASRLDFKRLLLLIMATFSAGQLLCAGAPSFPLLVASRLVVAAAHAVFWSVVAVTATRVVSPEHASMAVGVVTAGGSVANIAGMPVGRAIGLALGWRLTFVTVGVAGLVTLAALAWSLPAMPAGEPFSLRRLPSLFRNRPLVALYGVTVAMSLSYYTGYGLIEPFLSTVAGLSDEAVTLVLMGFGVAALVGIALFSRLYDRAHAPFLVAAMSAQALVLLAMRPLADVPGGMAVDVAVWGVAEACYATAFQTLLIEITPPDDSAVAMSVYSGLFNLGIGGGTWLGARVAEWAGIGCIGYVGGACALAGIAVALSALFPALRATGHAAFGGDGGGTPR